jgi:hypothetical protein
MKSRAELSADIDSVIRKYVPGWKVISKADSAIHKAIGCFFAFLKWLSFGRVNVAYMDRFWTTLGFTAACPEGEEDEWEVRPHEGKHARQAKKWSRPLLGFLYLFPQSFLPFLFAVLAVFFSSWFWFGLIFFLVPLPAPWRALWELQAYEISVMKEVWQWDDDEDINKYIDRIIRKRFAGGVYFYMMPIFTGWIRKRLMRAKEKARVWETLPDRDPYIDDIYSVLKAGGRVHK